MVNKFILSFFYFFLISRFFSEKLRLFPKWVDIINYPLFIFLLFLLIIYLNKKYKKDNGENTFIVKIVLVFTFSFLVSIIFNSYRILPEATILFYIGFMEGPILFITLNKIIIKPFELASKINIMFFILLIINLAIIFFIDLPEFFVTGNPDVVSGTYGFNTYQFSMLLLICGGYLLGYSYVKKYRTWFVILSQIVIFVVFFITQFRAGLPFFLLSYMVMIGFLYGKKIVYRLIPLILVALLFIYIILYLVGREDKLEGLKFENWVELISNPIKYSDYGKFKIYKNIPIMWSDNPHIFLIGTGPGNFMSRANYTFSIEMMRGDKGVAMVIKDLFGLQYPYFSDVHNKYIRHSIKSEAIFGTWQLSVPYTSYLSAIAEIGIIGGICILLMYLYLIKISIRYLGIIRKKFINFVPLSVCLIGSTTYIFGLAFLENYWEVARVTLPVWLLFWSVKTIAYYETES